MGLFDFFKHRSAKTKTVDKYNSMSRIEYLMNIHHENMEKSHEAYGDITFVELVERQFSEGETELAASNVGTQVCEYFELANLYWGQGDLEKAKNYLTKTLERHQRFVDACSEYDLEIGHYHGMENAKAASCLLEMEYLSLDNSEALENDCEPWYRETILDYCVDDRDFEVATWQAAEDAWVKNRFPKYRLAEFDVYIKALTGQYETTKDMLDAHEKMFKGRGKRKNADSYTIDGYDDNELIIDYIFASILKRIGWEGRYRHSWPNTDSYNSTPETTREPDRYLKIIAASSPEADPNTSIIIDTQKARRYIDHHLKNQLFERGEYYSAERTSKTRSKVSGALRDLGLVKDPATLDLMRTYQMDHVLNETTHIFLCDPVEKAAAQLKRWTNSLTAEFNLHPDFIAIVGSEEKSDYLDPQGSWYVYWKKDKQIYAVERDDWYDPVKATKDAKLGLTLWPSYTSFVAWWVSEHLKSEFS